MFYQEAFSALSITHDASKGAYKRTLRTGLSNDDFSDYFAEFCFRSYREEKFELSSADFVKYFNEVFKNKASVTSNDFLFDLRSNLCLMYKESGKYHFTHRSFQEYFCALFLSKQKDKFIGRLEGFFEKRSRRMRGDCTLSMLYDMIPDKLEEYVFVPFLSKLFEKCDQKDGYWTFLKLMYPEIGYENGDVSSYSCNDPTSYLFDFITGTFDIKYKFTQDDLPFYDSLIIETYYKKEKKPDKNNCFDEDYRDFEEDDDYDEELDSDIDGYILLVEVSEILEEKDKYKNMINMLDNDEFIFKKEYLETRKFLSQLKKKQKFTDDNLFELL